MNRRILASALLLTAFVVSPAPADPWSAWGPALARHELRTAAGETMMLNSLRGEVVVVNFWASWCKPCKKELRLLDEWAADLSRQGVRVAAVSIDRDPRKAEKFVDAAGLSLPIYFDGPDGLASTLDLPSLPCTVLVDGSGNVVEVIQDGSLDSLRALRGTAESLARDASREADPEVSG